MTNIQLLNKLMENLIPELGQYNMIFLEEGNWVYWRETDTEDYTDVIKTHIRKATKAEVRLWSDYKTFLDSAADVEKS